MNPIRLTLLVAAALLAVKWAVQLWLERLNRRAVLAHASEIPAAFQAVMDAPTYRKSINYTLAHGSFSQVELTWNVLVLAVLLFSGILGWSFHWFSGALGLSSWAMAAWLCAIGVLLSLPGLPLDWYSHFRLEERFGFNTTTLRLWCMDRIKGMLLSLLLGYPLLVLVLKLVSWTGYWWWLWAWGVILLFQVIMMVLAPVLIMPLFNKFTPLPEGALRDRLLGLARRTNFRAASIQMMDGSKRSRHSNAFFTGFGQFRKIVLFDTLIQQLSEPELEAVLAHEIGHYKKRHILKMLVFSAFSTLAGLFLVSFLARQPWFCSAFGLPAGSVPAALLLFGLLAGVVTFWFSPVAHWWSRRYEYEADAYAAAVMKEGQSLIGALRKLNEKNLSNLTPHPIYSGFYYSHPTLLERERALQ
jgi:STE24 endopeptidase